VNTSNQLATRLRLGVAGTALVIALGAAPAFAQTVPAKPAPAAEEESTIVVTGSLLRRTSTESASPLTVITADDLEKRGVATVEGAIQLLSSNNGGTLENSFTANGAFAGGASAASLRGLTTSSTLVLFDGLRATYYPLADDGSRNFVDLNTIPDAIVDRVEVLKDGASANYGADAVAGVVNIITKKQIKGFLASAQAGISEKGDAGNQRLSATYGFGSLEDNGFNAYITGNYYKSDPLYNRDRGAPYNAAANLTSRCNAAGSCDFDNINLLNGVRASGAFSGLAATTAPLVGVATATGGLVGRFQFLNPAVGCGNLRPITLTAAQLTANPAAPSVVCEQDLIAQYGQIAPRNERIGASARTTFKIGGAEAYAMINFNQSSSSYVTTPSAIIATAPPAETGVRYTTGAGNRLLLPVYVCAARVNCTAANGTLNPNNPFAASGQRARVLLRLQDIESAQASRNRVFRGAVGIKGSLGGSWNFNLEATGSKSTVRRTFDGYIFIQHLLDVVADGTYNFVNPSLNSQSVRDYLTPRNTTTAKSSLYQVQGSVNGDLMELPGGPLQIGVGASFRRESVNAPSANSDRDGPTQRYFRINAFGSAGKRNVYSAYGEINAPVLDQLTLNLAGRYDKYSSGQKAFSPKGSIEFTPIKQVKLRGTYSRGFRIPSFAESGALPTTGFVPYTPPPAFQALYPDGAGGVLSYASQYNIGLTQVGAAGLKPEKSRSFTGGLVVEPTNWLSFTVDYYNIRKTNVITGADYVPALLAYSTGQPIPTGFTITPDVPDTTFPNRLPRPLFVQYSFINGPRQDTSGFDFSATARIPLSDGIKLISSAEATYVQKYDQTFPDGTIQRYAGTLGNFQITSGSGTPSWRGSWQNTVDFGSAQISATAYYTSGYYSGAADSDNSVSPKDCSNGNIHTFADGSPVVCKVKSFVSVDMTGSVDINENMTFYVNVLNVANRKPPLDPTTYGGYQYNPAWAYSGIIGRAYRAGVKVKF
jgi:iron complex outermembrane recepter protein